MKSILLHVYDDTALESRLEAAFDLARAFGSHITCLHATPFEDYLAADPLVAAALPLEFSRKMKRRRLELQARVETNLPSAWKSNLQRMALEMVGALSPVIPLGLGAGETWRAHRSRSAVMHALIIEDESLIAMAIEDALRGCGFTSFDFAASDQEAVARKCPDLITADVELKPGCGIMAVQSICSDRPIPTLFITGSADQVKLRMPGHILIEKPFSAEHIMDAAKSIMESRDG